MTGREMILQAFDRLFEKAARKLSVECSVEEKDEAKRRFEERFSTLLDARNAIGQKEHLGDNADAPFVVDLAFQQDDSPIEEFVVPVAFRS